jgi:hypothetical protein
MGRPAHKPTEHTRKLVRQLSGLAVRHDDIAHLVEISDVSLRKHYASDLQRGRVEANLQVTRSLFQAATRPNNPNVVAQMFWLKNQAGWKDLPVAATAGDDINTLRIVFSDARAGPDAGNAGGTTIDGTAEDRTPPARHVDAPNHEAQTEAPEEPPFSIDFAEPGVEPEPESAAASTSETPPAQAPAPPTAPDQPDQPQLPGAYS